MRHALLVALVALVLAGCVNVRSVPANASDPAETLRAERGQPVVVRVRDDRFVRGTLGAVGPDSLRLSVGKRLLAWPLADICAVSTAARQQRGIGKGVAIGIGAGLLLTAYAVGAASSAEDEQFPYGAVIVAGAVAMIPPWQGVQRRAT